MSNAAPTATEPLFDAAQTPALLRLLGEYTVKLKQECDTYEKKEDKYRLMLGRVGFGCISLVLILALVIWVDFYPNKSPFTHPSPFLVPHLLTYVWFGITALYIAGAVNGTNYIRKDRKQMRLQVTAVATQLERIVRRLSPIAEHGNVGLGEKMELDLRLADADTVLEQAARYVEKQER